MRIRPFIPLPGPFVLTSGRSRPNAGGVGLLVLLGLFYLGAWFKWPAPMLYAHAAVAAVVVIVLAVRARVKS